MPELAATLPAFLAATAERDRPGTGAGGVFELETDRFLDINLGQAGGPTEAWIKTGVMVAYTGDVKFVREKMLEQGLGQFLKKAVTGEGARLTRATGSGSVFCADAGKKITLLKLEGDSLVVNGNDLLAFETSLSHEVKMMRSLKAALAAGLFNVRLEGHGTVAVSTHYDPLTLPVRPGEPVTTDPNATVMWSGDLTPAIKTDIQLKTLVGRGSGESIQMLFEGDGFVTVQPFEEVPVVTTTG